jgi:transcriptional regulator with XRE-family HTH domain
MSSLGETVRNRRLAASMTQDQLATAVGLSRSWIQQIEAGQITNPGSEQLVKLAKVLELPLTSLFTEQQRQAVIQMGQISAARLDAAKLLHTLTMLDDNLDTETDEMFDQAAHTLAAMLARTTGTELTYAQAHAITDAVWREQARDRRVWLVGAYISRYAARSAANPPGSPLESSPESSPPTPRPLEGSARRPEASERVHLVTGR